jgi:hypothetical protein
MPVDDRGVTAALAGLALRLQVPERLGGVSEALSDGVDGV